MRNPETEVDGKNLEGDMLNSIILDMPLGFPCPDVLRDCDCSFFPVRNFSQEQADINVTFCTVTVAARTGTSFASPCTQTCERPVGVDAPDGDCSELSDVVICAQTAAQECQNNDPDPPNHYTTTFLNHQRTCTVECPDGSTFDWIVPAGVIGSAWQGDADARAYALACKRATAHRICFVTESPLTPVCVGEFASIPIIAQGGTPGYTYALILGSIPIGMTFDPVGLIQGTPVAAVMTMFTVEVTDAIGSTQSKQFTLRVVEIASPTALPSGTQNIAYNYMLLTAGTSGTVVWTLASGALPDGLTLSTAGVISGTPTVPGSFSFNLSLIDGAGASCSKDFTIQIVPGVLIAAYWAMEVLSGGNLLLDSTPNGVDIDANFLGSIAPGKVADCFECSGAPIATDFVLPAQMLDISNGITVCGWVRAVDFTESISTASIIQLNWGGDFFILEFDGAGNYALTLEVGIDSPDITAPTIDDNGWHFYRAWYDPADGRVRLQIDSGIIHVSVDTLAPPAAFAGGNIVIGAQIVGIPGNTWQWDETGVWMRVLSDAEAAQLWNGGAGTTYPSTPP